VAAAAGVDELALERGEELLALVDHAAAAAATFAGLAARAAAAEAGDDAARRLVQPPAALPRVSASAPALVSQRVQRVGVLRCFFTAKCLYSNRRARRAEAWSRGFACCARPLRLPWMDKRRSSARIHGPTGNWARRAKLG
jgi:hypothetical protein